MGTYTSMQAEHLALMEGLRVATVESNERDELELYTDCEPLVDKMLHDTRNRGDWRERRASYEWMASKWDECSLGSVGRELNKRAHRLAVEAFDNGKQQ